eukprot:TRINITY_DN5849_c0_g1_i1.p1 TRINITY_DN5849_c0_g1~~TRINITY_DN5849_c0_g1_i1.p1  ORF type:complete len:310 (+),score=69.72 TRINITY_DN5849_c0_g1_i1:148-1077(+)
MDNATDDKQGSTPAAVDTTQPSDCPAKTEREISADEAVARAAAEQADADAIAAATAELEGKEMTPEERAAARRQLEAEADRRRLLREEEERKRDAERERRRIADSKALRVMKEEREALQRQKALAERRAAAASDKAARAHVMAKLEQDKRERAARLGKAVEDLPASALPADAPRSTVAERVEAEVKQKADQLATDRETIDACCALIAATPEPAAAAAGAPVIGMGGKQALVTLRRIVGNLLEQPTLDRFRRLPKSAAAVRNLTAIDGATDLLQAIGFVSSDESFALPKVSLARLQHTKLAIDGHLVKLG